MSFNFKDVDSSKAVRILSENGVALRGGLHCAPTTHKAIGTLPDGTVRASFSVFNNLQEVDTLITLCNNKKILQKMLN